MLTNKIIVYLVSRYLTYFLQFVTSLIIAAKLDPYYMGVWGFLLLIINFFNQIHLGIGNSVNVLLIHNKGKTSKEYSYLLNSFLLVVYVSILAIIGFLCYCYSGSESIQKYRIDSYIIYIAAIIVLQYFINLFINVFRVKNKIGYVTFSQSIVVILNFVTVFFFAGESLVKYLVITNFIGCLLAALSVIPSKVYSGVGYSQQSVLVQSEILKKGILLFLYNTCSVFIIISTRTFVSNHYSVEEFGLFTFSYSFAHAMLLFLDALSFIVFPKLIDRMSSDNFDDVHRVVKTTTSYYCSCAHALVLFSLLFFPVLLSFFPKYSDSLSCLNITAIAILLPTYSFGCGTLLVARNEEKKNAIISFISLIVNCVFSYILIFLLGVSFSRAIMSCMIAYLVMTFCFNYYGYRILNKTLHQMLMDFFPLKLLIPYITALIICLFDFENLIFIPIIIYLVLNYRDIQKFYSLIVSIIKNDKLFNI